jgi:LemA protein
MDGIGAGLIVLIALVVFGVIVVLWFVGIYNSLIRARNEVQSAWSHIDVQLKRRHDLIPNLVETARGYMQHERSTMEAVTQARNLAASARTPAEAGVAEGRLSAALGTFFMVSEAYPDLKANTNFLQLQGELTETENRLSFVRQGYNDAAMRFNNLREVFPNSLIAGSFTRAEMFEIANPAERETPQVKF